jgi:hypothetical protein
MQRAVAGRILLSSGEAALRTALEDGNEHDGPLSRGPCFVRTGATAAPICGGTFRSAGGRLVQDVVVVVDLVSS